ncbi:MAG: hypothetical protein WCG06_02630 [Candidatus Omnitrophota bacterium]
MIRWPKVRDLEQLTEFVRAEKISYGILDLPTTAYNMDVYRRYFAVGPAIGMRPLTELPAPFKRLPKPAGFGPLCEFYVFE